MILVIQNGQEFIKIIKNNEIYISVKLLKTAKIMKF